MKPEIKELWIAALTSGEYKQGTGCLRNSSNEYCCLGVLTDLYQKQTGDGFWTNPEDRSYFMFNFVGGDGIPDKEGSVLPLPVQEWAGLDANPTVCNRPSTVDDITDPEENLDGYQPSIAEYNDAEGISFTSIVEIIKANF